MHIIAAKAVAFHEAMQPEFIEYQKAVLHNARVLAEELENIGLRIVSGGTENHLILVDLSRIGITGREAEEAFDSIGLTVNKNVIPFDPRPPRITSGLRLGTPAITTRGLGTNEVKKLAHAIGHIISNFHNEKAYEEVRLQVKELTEKFPAPGIVC